jgi:hypothetical protein
MARYVCKRSFDWSRVVKSVEAYNSAHIESVEMHLQHRCGLQPARLLKRGFEIVTAIKVAFVGKTSAASR